MSSVAPSEEIVAGHRQTVLLLLQIYSSVSRTTGSGVAKCVIPFCLGVHIRVSLNMVVGSRDSDATGNMKPIKVDTMWGRDLRLC
jgi:hypothetical protein